METMIHTSEAKYDTALMHACLNVITISPFTNNNSIVTLRAKHRTFDRVCITFYTTDAKW